MNDHQIFIDALRKVLDLGPLYRDPYRLDAERFHQEVEWSNPNRPRRKFTRTFIKLPVGSGTR